MKFSELQRLQRMEGITALSADERIEQLEARLRTITKERDALRAALQHETDCVEAAKAKIEALRSKITEMEKQEPFDADSDVFRSAFEAALKAGNWPATRQGDGYRSPSTQIAWRIAFSTANRLKLYLSPGAHPKLESSVPDGWKLVPIEPTTEIRKAMHYAYWQSPQLPYHDGSPELWNAAYAAMLEAAPEAKP